MYQIGKIEGVTILADTDSTTAANALTAILKAVTEMRWRDASELPPKMPGEEHSDRLLVEAPDWQERVLFGRYIHCLDEWRVASSNFPANVTRWMPPPKPMPTKEEIAAVFATMTEKV